MVSSASFGPKGLKLSSPALSILGLCVAGCADEKDEDDEINHNHHNHYYLKDATKNYRRLSGGARAVRSGVGIPALYHKLPGRTCATTFKQIRSLRNGTPGADRNWRTSS